MLFGEKLKKLRKEKNLTQQNLADEFFVTRQAITKWENNQSTPDAQMIKTIANFFDVTTDYLLNEEEIQSEIKDSEKFDNSTTNSTGIEVVIAKKKSKRKIILIIAVLMVLISLPLIILTIVNSIEAQEYKNQIEREEKTLLKIGFYVVFDKTYTITEITELKEINNVMYLFENYVPNEFEYKRTNLILNPEGEYDAIIPDGLFHDAFVYDIFYTRYSGEFIIELSSQINLLETDTIKIDRYHIHKINPIINVKIKSYDVNMNICKEEIFTVNQDGTLNSSIEGNLKKYTLDYYNNSNAIGYSIELIDINRTPKIINIWESESVLIYICTGETFNLLNYYVDFRI